MLEVSVFLDEDDFYQGHPMHEYLMHYLMHHHILGATLLAAMAGYGHKRHLHYPKKIGSTEEIPLIIIFVDDEIKIQAVLPHIKEVVKEGLIVLKKVERA